MSWQSGHKYFLSMATLAVDDILNPGIDSWSLTLISFKCALCTWRKGWENFHILVRSQWIVMKCCVCNNFFGCTSTPLLPCWQSTIFVSFLFHPFIHSSTGSFIYSFIHLHLIVLTFWIDHKECKETISRKPEPAIILWLDWDRLKLSSLKMIEDLGVAIDDHYASLTR